MYFKQIFEENLAQYAYIVGCQRTGEAIVIDPMRDIDRYVKIAAAEDLKIVAVTETHIHADYLSGAREFAEQYGVKLYLSDEGDANWKYFWAKESNYDYDLVKNGDTFKVGNIELKVWHTPGHTPEHICFFITDLGGGADEPMGIATGDFVFVGDLGRPDLLESAAGQVGAREPSARVLYNTVQGFFDLPDYMQIWPGHGAGSACGKALGAVPETTVGYERRFNASIAAAKDGEQAFVDSILSGQPEPPMYFAQMKHDNKFGPAILGGLPTPEKVDASKLQSLAKDKQNVIVDARNSRTDFMANHIAGSLYAPLDKTFPTITGSYLTRDMNIYLVLENGSDAEEAVRNLIRIGFDNIKGYALVSEVEALSGLASTSSSTTSSIEQARQADATVVLDVRREAEFAEGHIPNAQNIAHTRLMARLDELNKDTRYLVHCRTGARAAAAVAYLEREGFDAVYVDGDYSDWHLESNVAEMAH